jgi:hypothetical protein
MRLLTIPVVELQVSHLACPLPVEGGTTVNITSTCAVMVIAIGTLSELGCGGSADIGEPTNAQGQAVSAPKLERAQKANLVRSTPLGDNVRVQALLEHATKVVLEVQTKPLDIANKEVAP